MSAEQRIEVTGYFVLVVVLAFAAGWFWAKGHWAAVISGIVGFTLIFVGIQSTKERS